ncbi:uncharacterized protein LOC132066270 [Lycium ferocissimum]|uniref:uncharacterized protein LOC132066270 n=1 Tax=Lycium ferocissimum TaxID=112874 RepID=UPI0028164B45|nr:uncharacterized protein LOC132066270 [Lycium ferocissimum]
MASFSSTLKLLQQLMKSVNTLSKSLISNRKFSSSPSNSSLISPSFKTILKDQVIHNKPLSLYVLRDHTRSIEKEFLITYSVMGLPSSDLQQFLSDLQLLEENTVQLLWAGKELTRGKKLCDFIGRNEKTKVHNFFLHLTRIYQYTKGSFGMKDKHK